MKIFGKYDKDSNFITVYVNNYIYTIAKKTGHWSYKKIGDICGNGVILTKEEFKRLESQAEYGYREFTLN